MTFRNKKERECIDRNAIRNDPPICRVMFSGSKDAKIQACSQPEQWLHFLVDPGSNGHISQAESHNGRLFDWLECLQNFWQVPGPTLKLSAIQKPGEQGGNKIATMIVPLEPTLCLKLRVARNGSGIRIAKSLHSPIFLGNESMHSRQNRILDLM
jgi:hypothetical protein